MKFAKMRMVITIAEIVIAAELGLGLWETLDSYRVGKGEARSMTISRRPPALPEDEEDRTDERGNRPALEPPVIEGSYDTSVPETDRRLGDRRTEGQPKGLKKLVAVLGPGLITGASDDDPSGVGTYSTAGASTGYTYLW